jgi:hypothetical protein
MKTLDYATEGHNTIGEYVAKTGLSYSVFGSVERG